MFKQYGVHEKEQYCYILTCLFQRFILTETLNSGNILQCLILMFVRALLHMRREEKPTRCHLMVYCTYDMFNMFRELLCPSSGALGYTCVITAYGVLFLAAGCRGSGTGQQGVLPGRRMLHEVQNPSFWAHTLLPLFSMQIREVLCYVKNTTDFA